MVKIFTTYVLLILSVSLMAQTRFSGKVLDAVTGEPLVGATVVVTNGLGTITDFDGNFHTQVTNGEYDVEFSFVGYKPQKQKIVFTGKAYSIEVKLDSKVINEITIIADFARERETAVAFSTIVPKKIEEELGTRDIPMLLNSTPGVYASNQGGGDGDATITIRGFESRNVAVLIDGIPVNDMETGYVYWSNWSGLDAITQTIQIQRGLGASKLALPAVGGTMNIITKSVDSKAGGSVSQTVGADGDLRTSFGYNSGKFDNGWGLTLAGAYKRGDGFVDFTWSRGWFFYMKVEKKIQNHIFSLTGSGASQQHGQRSYKSPIATFDKKFAEEQGVTVFPTVVDKGFRYNQHGGYLERWTLDENGNRVDAEKGEFNEMVNYYFKPQFNFRHFWNSGGKFSISNIAYLSVGSGGGARGYSSSSFPVDPITGLMNFQVEYDKNITQRYNHPDYPGKQVRNGFIRSAVNEHFWYGLLSTFNYELASNLSFSGGVDLRNYKGSHYDEVYDLMGGDYVINISDPNSSEIAKREGDKINKNFDGLVRWGGVFGVVNYTYLNLRVFANFTASMTQYKKIHYFLPKVIHLSDTTLEIGYDDVVDYKGITYDRNSAGLDYQQTDWYNIPGYTFKMGANYNFSKNHSAFVNVGYMSKATRFNNVYEYANIQLMKGIDNEYVRAIEMGYTFSSRLLAINLNGYVTEWINKPLDRAVTVRMLNEDGEPEYYSTNINGMSALHKGIELDFAYNMSSKIKIQGLLSLGDWRWNSEDSIFIRDEITDEIVSRQYFNAKGVHVGDAAQTQVGGNIRFEPIRDVYFTLNYIFFDRYYSQFDPSSLRAKSDTWITDAEGKLVRPFGLDADGKPRDSWMIPSYGLFDFNAGYSMVAFKKIRLKLSFNVFNVLDTKHITVAQNNDQYISPASTNFDAQSASVFFGLGRRYSATLKVSF